MEATQKFIRRVDHAEIPMSSKIEVDLAELRNEFGNDFNTLIITNTDATKPVEIYLDGIKSFFVAGNNGITSFDWEFGINYNFVSIENLSAAAVIVANAVKISVGRSGKTNGV